MAMAEYKILEIFYDYVCPWSYFSTGCIEQLHREFEIDIRWTTFPFHPGTPPEGQTLDALFADKKVDTDKMVTLLKRVASRLGLPFEECKNIYNSRLAQELGKFAESKSKGLEFHKAMFRAYFAKGKNIGKNRVLVDVAESINLNGNEIKKIIQNRTYKKAIDLDWKRSRRLKITVIPTFLLNGQVLVGAQQYQTLENLLLSNRVKRRKQKRTSLQMKPGRNTAFQPVENPALVEDVVLYFEG